MKCDELKAYKADVTIPVYGTIADADVYLKDKADEAIEELKKENERLKDKLRHYPMMAALIGSDNKEIRRLKRALWLARASEASKEVNYWTCQDESSYAIVDFNIRHETIVSYKSPHHRPYKWILIWDKVERKCREKAEEYK